MLLTVVNPSDDGQHRMHERAVVHAVLAMETDGLRIVLTEEVIGMHQRIFVAEETEHMCRLAVVAGMQEVLLGQRAILLHQRLVHVELLHPVLPGRKELLLAREPMALHGLGYLEGRIGQDAVVAREHLGKHAAHRRTDDEPGLLLGARVAQQLQCLLGMNGQVRSHHTGTGQHLAQTAHRARLSTGAEAMNVENGLSRHQFGKLFDILVIHN